MPTIRHITVPAGFVAAGVKCGIKASGKHDLAVIAADHDASTALLTTQNQVVGAPVLWCRQIMPKGFGRARAVVINAGCSNVCTGKAGLKDAQTMASLTAKKLGTSAEKVLVASTGIIGHRLPMEKVRAGIDAAAASLSRLDDGPVLRSIMTTDTKEKYAVVQSHIGGKQVTVAGIAKGSGMIAPHLATMISVVTTDAAVAPAALYAALTSVANDSYNAATVDTDTSTSDTVVAFASGDAGNTEITTKSPDYKKFVALLREVCVALARAIAADGEGANHFIEIAVRGAKSDVDAQIAAKSVAESPLFKCAVHGGDPNWGRIAAALGKSRARVVPEKLSIRIGQTRVFSRGEGCKFDPKAVSEYLKLLEVKIDCDLGLGKGKFTAFTCDYSREYIAINADYHT